MNKHKHALSPPLSSSPLLNNNFLLLLLLLLLPLNIEHTTRYRFRRTGAGGVDGLGVGYFRVGFGLGGGGGGFFSGEVGCWEGKGEGFR